MFNLGDVVIATVIGEITEIRKVGSIVKYTIQGENSSQAYVAAPQISFPKGDKK